MPAQFSTAALLGIWMNLVERVRHLSYGGTIRTPRGDVNGDGMCDIIDENVTYTKLGTTIGSANYTPDMDLDRSGVIDAADYDLVAAELNNPNPSYTPGNQISNTALNSPGPRNPVGYCGYLFNSETRLYTVRFRNYSPTLGRWLERDPAGYVDGLNLYEYVESRPLTLVDPMGLDGCDIKQDLYLRARGVLPTRAEERAAREAERQARLARLRKNGISTTDDFIFWYYNGDGQPVPVSPSLEREFREHENIKPVIQKSQNDAIEKAIDSMPKNFNCKPGASWNTTVTGLQDPRSTNPCIANPGRATYSYGNGFIKASVNCKVTVVECASKNGKCKPTKVKVDCKGSFSSDDMFREPFGDIGGDPGDPYWFTTRWFEDFSGSR